MSRPTACIAVGQGRERARPLVERWDGRTWSVQPTPDTRGQSSLSSVSCVSAEECIAVGGGRISRHRELLAEHWNGRRWSMQPIATPSLGGLSSVSCPTAHACIAVGSEANHDHRALMERWNGRRWSMQLTARTQKPSSLTSVSCTSATRCVAVGAETVFAPIPCGYGGSPCDQPQPKPRFRTLAETWNGSSWSIQRAPSPKRLSTLTSVSCTSPNACTAVGGNYSSSLLAERWDGHQWSVQSLPRFRHPTDLNAVFCTSRNGCTAVGARYLPRPERTLTLFER